MLVLLHCCTAAAAAADDDEEEDEEGGDCDGDEDEDDDDDDKHDDDDDEEEEEEDCDGDGDEDDDDKHDDSAAAADDHDVVEEDDDGGDDDGDDDVEEEDDDDGKMILLLLLMMIPLLSLCPGDPLQADNDKHHLEDYLRSMTEARTAAMQQGIHSGMAPPTQWFGLKNLLQASGSKVSSSIALHRVSRRPRQPAAAAASALPLTTPILSFAPLLPPSRCCVLLQDGESLYTDLLQRLDHSRFDQLQSCNSKEAAGRWRVGC